MERLSWPVSGILNEIERYWRSIDSVRRRKAQSVSVGSSLAQALDRDANLSLVALRLSGNKFTGRRTTDTGNRLFNTTHLH